MQYEMHTYTNGMFPPIKQVIFGETMSDIYWKFFYAMENGNDNDEYLLGHVDLPRLDGMPNPSTIFSGNHKTYPFDPSMDEFREMLMEDFVEFELARINSKDTNQVVPKLNELGVFNNLVKTAYQYIIFSHLISAYERGDIDGDFPQSATLAIIFKIVSEMSVSEENRFKKFFKPTTYYVSLALYPPFSKKSIDDEDKLQAYFDIMRLQDNGIISQVRECENNKVFVVYAFHCANPIEIVQKLSTWLDANNLPMICHTLAVSSRKEFIVMYNQATESANVAYHPLATYEWAKNQYEHHTCWDALSSMWKEFVYE